MAILVVRHGPTAMNKAEGERVRGWLDVPLTPAGHDLAQKIGQNLAKAPIQHIFSSDMQRTMDTAAAWAAASGVGMTAHPELRPWHLGALIGQPEKEVDPLIDALAAHGGARPPGGGESYHDFLRRYMGFLGPMLHDPHLYGVVTHGRNIRALASAVGGRPWAATDSPKPGGAVYLDGHQVLPVNDGVGGVEAPAKS